MSSKSLIIFTLFCVILVAGEFEIKLKYCKFRCFNRCKPKKEPVSVTKQPKDYYWRDFYGQIPPDAFPLGKSNQFPQTYIGLAYDPSRNGTFIVTIVEGLDYVYTILNGAVTKISQNIQILCTKSPSQLIWMRVTKENAKTIANAKLAQGGYHITGTANKKIIKHVHHIARTAHCNVMYAGFITQLNQPMEYALMDGTNATTQAFMWLMYRPAKIVQEIKRKSQPFFSHFFKYTLRPDSIIPTFFKQINIGSCSLICTNENTDREREFKKNKNLKSSLAYYWKPNRVFKEEEAIPVGEGFGKVSYLGQTYNQLNALDVGELTPSGVRMGVIRNVAASYHENTYYQVLSSNVPEKFEWINTTTETFPSLNASKLIPGGQIENDAKIYVGRDPGPYATVAGSVRAFKEGAICQTKYGSEKKFQVLMFNDGKKDNN